MDRYNKKEREKYNSFYKLSKKEKRLLSLIPIYVQPKVPIPLPLTGSEKICKRFGCGKHLTLRESLFGDLCIKCQQKNNNPDPCII